MSENVQVYEFKPQCGCGRAGVVRATIDDVAEAGWPICPECGDDMERVSSAGQEHVVRITVEGGVVQDVQHPPGIKVVVRDYDTEDVSEDMLQEDEDGNEYLETIW